MKEYEIKKWCQQNNWDEPRQLNNGTWVAFPPGGVIETPLPIEFGEPMINRVQDALNALVLIIAGLIVGAIALIFSPFFFATRISRHKKSQSQP